MKRVVYGTSVTAEEKLIVLLENRTYWVMCAKLSTAVVGSAMT